MTTRQRIKKSFGLYLILFALLLCSCGQPSVGDASGGHSEQDEGPTWQEQYDLGLRYLSEGNYEEAIIAFTAAIEIDPKRAPAYVGRGDAHSGSARKLSGQDAELPAEAVSSYESAVADYLAALDLDESTVEVYRKAAEVYVTLGDLDSAVALLERGVAATGDEDLQSYLDELIESQSEATEVMTVSGRIIYNPDEYGDSWQQYIGRYQDDANRTICAIMTFGIRFDSPVRFELDSSEAVLQEAEFANIEPHFDSETDLYNSQTSSPGPMLGRLIEMTGYFIKRDPPGELTGPEKNNYDSGEFTEYEYTYHPNGDYVFFIESYQLLD